jgi:hypothetical protein
MNIIFNVIDLVGQDKYYGSSENIEILKGKYELTNNILKNLEKVKRSYLLNKNNK